MSLSLSTGVLVETRAVRVTVEPSPARLSLRARGDLAPLEAALGLTLPGAIAQTATGVGLEAARLGPDEWVLVGREDQVAAAIRSCAGVYETLPHSLVDISGREVTLLIEGPCAADLLSFACPRDIDAIAVCAARRTIFDGATVVLWRDAPDRFRMDIWRSFAPHLAHLMVIAAKELAAEAA